MIQYDVDGTYILTCLDNGDYNIRYQESKHEFYYHMENGQLSAITARNGAVAIFNSISDELRVFLLLSATSVSVGAEHLKTSEMNIIHDILSLGRVITDDKETKHE